VLTFVASVDGRRRLARVKVKVGDVDEQRMVLGEGSPFRADRAEPFVHHLVHEPHVFPHVGSGVLGSLAERAGHVPEGGEEVGQTMHVHIGLCAELLQTLWTLGHFFLGWRHLPQLTGPVLSLAAGLAAMVVPQML